jgi:hypothetical protein
MTRFWRDGYLRYSKYGGQHWVEGHWVDRNSWDRSGGGASREQAHLVLSEWAVSFQAASSFTRPNAECPVCGASVFFYRNTYGSRVFFDDLGPPWPKHPCTDNGRYLNPRPSSAKLGPASPALRRSEEISAIRFWLGRAERDLAERFKAVHHQAAWPWVRIVERLEWGLHALLAVRIGRLDQEGERDAILLVSEPEEALVPGAIAFLKGTRLSYFDPSTASAAETKAERITGIPALVARLAEGA